MDRTLFQSGLFNLIDNAVRFNVEEGEIVIKTATQVSQKFKGETTIFVDVLNTCPISQDVSRVLNYSIHGNGTPKELGGMFGLSTCDHLVRVHGGFMTVTVNEDELEQTRKVNARMSVVGFRRKVDAEKYLERKKKQAKTQSADIHLLRNNTDFERARQAQLKSMKDQK